MRIALVNMPFSSLQLPSIALHQLESVLAERFGDRVEVAVHYLNHDFGARVGAELYAWISESLAGHTCGFGEWLFREAAFPDLTVNEEAYFSRYSHHFGAEQVARYQRELAPVRAELPAILDAMIDRCGLMEADIVGLTSMFFQNVPSFALARRLKARGAKATVVMGGANCEGTMGIEIVHHVPWIDYVFAGHALRSFPRFVEAKLAGDEAAPAAIDGVFCRANSRSIAALAEPPLPGDAKPEMQLDGIAANGAERPIEQAVAVDYTVYLDSYARHFGEHRADEIELLFETSRGCWWGEKAHCTFCGLNGANMGFREMGIAAARATIEALVGRYADRAKRFASVDNIIPRSYVDQLLPELKVPGHVSLFYEVRADLSREQLRTLARARVMEVQPGVESLATKTLKLMRKGTTAFNNLRFLGDCAAAGVKPVWNLLVGFPGEAADTFEMYRKNLPRLVHLPPPSGAFPVRFDRFSPYFTGYADYGLDLEPLDYHELIYPFAPQVIANLAYYFRDRNIDAPYQVDLAEHLGHLVEAVARWRERWESAGGAPRLRLVEDDMGWLVEDSRSGHRLEHELEEEDVALLRELEEPCSVNTIAEEKRESLAYLRDQGLLFEEGSRVMSLVMEGTRHPLDAGLHDFTGPRGSAEAAALGLTF
ncbi:RiPP maturation radical SAM C-methyltransferase [Endothiovibrio diazotrophicus]